MGVGAFMMLSFVMSVAVSVHACAAPHLRRLIEVEGHHHHPRPREPVPRIGAVDGLTFPMDQSFLGRALRTHQPVVVTDLMMPNIDGVEVLRRRRFRRTRSLRGPRRK